MSVEEDRQGFGSALATARRNRHLSQAHLSQCLRTAVPSAISAWERGKTVPDRSTVFRLEQILDLIPGYLSRHLGYEPPKAAGRPRALRTPEAIQNDPDLDEVGKALLLALYREIRTHPRLAPHKAKHPSRP